MKLKEEIRKLVVLQEIDKEIMMFEQRIEEIPLKMKDMDDEMAKFDTEFQQLEKEIKDLLVKKKEKENDIQSMEDQIKKHQKELNSLKSNDAYAAVIKEINDCKSKKTELEDQEIEMMEKEEMFLKQKDEKKKEYNKKKDEYNNIKKQLEDEKAQKEATLVEVKKKRDEYKNTIQENILGKYENLKKRKHGIGIVPLESGSCGGCHLMLTPQQVSDIVRGGDIVYCNACMRMLYIEESSDTIANESTEQK